MAFPASEPQDWAPLLLLALIQGDPVTGDLATYAEYAKTHFSPDAYLDPDKSSNWQHMIGACLLWMDPSTAVDGTGLPFPCSNIVEWWEGLLQSQAGQAGQTGENAPDTMFQYFGLSEPLSCIYEQFRWGSILAVRLLALRFPANQQSPALLTATARYSEILCGLLALGGAGWTAQEALWDSTSGDVFKGADGPWYDGPTFSPVSERSEAPGLETDLGPLWCMATGWPGTSKRMQWPATIGGYVLAADPDGRFGAGPGFQAAVNWLQSPGADTLSAVLDTLQGIKIWSPQYWLTWPGQGLLVYKTEHLNGNTPCIFWSWSVGSNQSIALGWPWPPGRNREQSPSCQCAIDGSQITATVQAPGAVPATMTLPSGNPAFSVTGDTTGIKLSS